MADYHDITMDSLLEKINRLEQESVRIRRGQVTATNPLEVDLGGSGESIPTKALDVTSLSIGDRVYVLRFGNDPGIVLGRVSYTPG